MIKNILIVICISLYFYCFTYAQEKLKRKEFEKEMLILELRKQFLLREKDYLLNQNFEIMNQLKSQLINCYLDLLSILKADFEKVWEFENNIQKFENSLKDTTLSIVEKKRELKALQGNRISALPEFFTKVHVELPKIIENLKKGEQWPESENKF